MKLDGNTVLVTGGGSGIGLALAGAFQAQGSRVIICGRDGDKLAAAQRDSPALETVVCDIADTGDQAALVEYMAANHPDMNILVNNAGVQYACDFTDGDHHEEMINTEIAINLAAPLALTDRFLPHLMRQRESAIVNVTSALARVPKQSAPVYCATKAGLHNFTRALRYQLENTGVKVFEIIPALVDTAMTSGRGKDKITPAALAGEALQGIAADRYEIRIGKTRALFALDRWLPAVAEKIIRPS